MKPKWRLLLFVRWQRRQRSLRRWRSARWILTRGRAKQIGEFSPANLDICLPANASSEKQTVADGIVLYFSVACSATVCFVLNAADLSIQQQSIYWRCHHHLHHSLLQYTPANPGSPGKWPLKQREMRERESQHTDSVLGSLLLLDWFVSGLGIELVYQHVCTLRTNENK